MFGRFTLFICLCVLLDSIYVLTAKNELVTIDLVSEGYGPRGHRTKRDVRMDTMPDVLTFEMKLQDKALTLSLTKSSLLHVATEDVATTLQANKVPMDSAVYTDPRYASTFIIHRNNGIYNLTGTFTVSGATWSLEPVEGDSIEPKAVASHTVELNGGAKLLNFGNDGVKDTIERPELIHTRGNAHLFKHPGHRHRRALTRHVIEIAYIVDNVDYMKFVTLYGSTNALQQIRLWYTYVADSVKGMYESIADPDISISTTVTVLKVLTTAAQDSFIANITTNNQFDANVGLGLLATWAQSQTDIPLSDHYMLFTGRDILSASGMAFVARVCTVQGVSIVENDFTGTVPHVAAHELGHSTSSDHDSQTGGFCTDNDQYIMASITAVSVAAGNAGKPWRFSNCSISKFKAYLSTKNCTRPEYTFVANVLPSPVQGQRGGDVISKDDQCRLALNSSLSSFYLFTPSDLANICSGMWCRVPNATNVSMIRPLGYTPCGTGLVCYQGFCVPDITTTTTTSTSTTTPTTTTQTTTTSTTTKPTTTTPTTTTTTSTTTKPTTTTPTTTTPTTTTSTTTKPTTTTPTTTTSTTTKPTATTPTTTTSTTTKPTTTTPTTTTSTTTKPTTTTPTTTFSTTAKPTTTTPTTTTSTTTRPTTTTTTTTELPITARAPPRTEADCYLDPYYRIGTRLAECLLYVWQHSSG